MTTSATARAFANIAFIKYWGNRDDELRLPANPSLSMNLDGLYAQTRVIWDDNLTDDSLILNDEPQRGKALERVSRHLDIMRQRLCIQSRAQVISHNNFPMGAGIASSAAAFAALTLAAAQAGGVSLEERELSALARRGSGSAARSIPSGFVVWHQGHDHESSYAESVAAPDHWDLVDVIAIISAAHKATGSEDGHKTAATSDLQVARVHGAQSRLETCLEALRTRDFPLLAQVVEHDSNLMHAVMMTSRPPLFYWLPTTLAVMQAVRQWRAEGLNICYTLDAGPNVHCLCLSAEAPIIQERLSSIPGVRQIVSAKPGGAAKIIA
ncbi:MAG: diphosphomevalonate decarboxylase [Anaerolineae bacterium]|nr:diphosphomevalonate decarboxylase [Anaerolineae bacterium]